MVGGKKQASKDASKKRTDSYTSVVKVRTFRELDDVLRNSFGNIKKDMLNLHETQSQQLTSTREIKSMIESMKSNFVSIDKFNLLKIKIAELNENLKKLWDLDKKVVELDAKTVAEADFDQQASEWENEFEKIRQDISSVKEKSSTETQLKKLVQDINDEFDKVKENIDQVRNIKNTITKGELDKPTDILNSQADDVRKGLKKAEKEIKNKVGVKQVEELITDINSEFDEVKELIAGVKQEQEKFVKKTDSNKRFKKVEDRIKELRAEVSIMSSENENFLTKTQAENLIDDVNKEFDSVKIEIDKSFSQIKQVKDSFLRKKEFIEADKDLRVEIEVLEKGLKDNANDLVELRNEMSREVEKKISYEDMSEEVKDLKNEIDRVRGKLDSVKNEVVSGKDLKKMNKKLKYHLVKIQDTFIDEDKFEALVDEVAELKAKLSGVKIKKVKAKKISARKLAKMRRKEELDYLMDEEVDYKPVKKSKMGTREYNGLFIFGNFLMIVAFALLLLAIGFFFWNKMFFTDSFAIAAVVCFIVGILIRILVLIKREN